MLKEAYGSLGWPPSNARAKTVLVVDDEPGIRLLLKAVLSRSGFNVILMKDGREALEHVENADCGVDAVVTDIEMPELDGVTLASMVMTKCPHVAVVLMSGFCSKSLSFDPEHAWVFVAKPFNPEELVGAVHAVIRARHTHP